MAESNNYFVDLYKIDLRDKVDKKNGLDYIAWSIAWAELKKADPNATYTLHKFGEGQLPYVYDPNTGYMVFTSVTAFGVTHDMQMAVTDGANKAMKAEPYTYTVRSGEKTVEAATMHDINTAIMRCLTKNIALHGIGLFVYNKEDAPEEVKEIEKLHNEIIAIINAKAKIGKGCVDVIEKLCKDADPEANGDPRLIMDVEVLKTLKKKILAVRKPKTEKDNKEE